MATEDIRKLRPTVEHVEACGKKPNVIDVFTKAFV